MHFIVIPPINENRGLSILKSADGRSVCWWTFVSHCTVFKSSEWTWLRM